MKISQKTIVIIGGLLFILGGIFHLLFWNWEFLNWENELTKLTEVNSNVMQMLNIGLMIFYFSFGFIMIYFRTEILHSKLGKTLLIFSLLYFLVRLIEEFVFPGGSITTGVILLICTLLFMIPLVIRNDTSQSKS